MTPDIDAIELVRQVLPFWVEWGSAMIVALIAALVALASSCAAERIALRAAAQATSDAPWPERARLIYPAKQALVASCFSSAMLSLALGIAFDGPFSALPRRGLAGVAAVVALAVGLWRYRSISQRLRPVPIPAGEALRGAATCMLLFFAAYLLLVPGFLVVPAQLDAGALAIVVIAAFVIGASNCGGALRLGIALRLISPASSRARRIVAAASERAGVDVKDVYEVRWSSANAIAFPLSRAVGFTDGALAHLSDAELEAICAHELGHLAEGRSALFVRALAPVAAAPLVLIVPLFASGGPVGLLLIGLWIVAVARIWGYVSRRLEARADAAAHGDVGGEVYARALERLYEVNLMPVVLSGTRTHPHLYDRMLAAGVEPAYPRPAPPPRWVARNALLASMTIGVLLTIAAPVALVAVSCGNWEDPTRLQASLLLPGTTVAPRLAVLARQRQDAGDAAAAAKLYRAAAELDPDDWSAAAHLAMTFVINGHCDNARALLAGARRGFCPDCAPSDGPTAALEAETATLVCGTPAAALLSSS